MIRMLMRLPSGAETTDSTLTARPAEGAFASVSRESKKPFRNASRALASRLLASASMASRSATSPKGGKSMAPNIILMRGSMRGSEAIFDGMMRFLNIDFIEHLTARPRERQPCPHLPDLRLR